MICVCKTIIPKNHKQKKQIDLPTYARVVRLTHFSFIYQERGKGEVRRSQSYNVAKMPRIPPAKEFPSTSPFLPQNPSSSFILEICIHPSIHSSIDGGDGQCSLRKGEFMANVPIMHACYNGYLTLPPYRPDLTWPHLTYYYLFVHLLSFVINPRFSA